MSCCCPIIPFHQQARQHTGQEMEEGGSRGSQGPNDVLGPGLRVPAAVGRRQGHVVSHIVLSKKMGLHASVQFEFDILNASTTRVPRLTSSSCTCFFCSDVPKGAKQEDGTIGFILSLFPKAFKRKRVLSPLVLKCHRHPTKMEQALWMARRRPR